MRAHIRKYLASFLLLAGVITAIPSTASANPSCTPSASAAASGGYIAESFTATTTCDWSVPVGVTRVDVLVVGGGGGGGNDSGGGGAGGGINYQSNYAVSGTITIVIGAGGNGSTNLHQPADSGDTGSASSFGSLTAAGGPGGTNFRSDSGNTPGGASISGYGAGGMSSYCNGGTCSSPANDGKPGGDGYLSTILGSTTYFGGGGGGGGWAGQAPNGGAGGAGGGGAGANGSSVGTSGTANTGGGGGASAAQAYAGGSGGSGIVIVRFLAGAGDFTTNKNASGVYRTNQTLTVSVVSPGKVTFLAKNKAIPGCKNVSTVGSGNSYTASCTYKPSGHGSVAITAVVSPLSSPGSTVTLNAGSFTIGTRVTWR